ncbi:oral cancer-overexpressed protein 1 isoform X2 [Myotis lucifugus]|uniref:oral cancer-overexpressed protein 1 isoform X2 n=1 Tax=Myotis lucifugus TaxID=59463 RepID=UPI000CCBEDAD|nr:oral cancer-overexpressed protein 1 isoform X2 [Myotis lucifugus]
MAGGQDLFDAIVMADNRFHGEGYQEGYEEGSSLGIIEGRQHGTVYGAKIGSEIGCYQGFAFAWRCLLHSRATEKDRANSTCQFARGLGLVSRRTAASRLGRVSTCSQPGLLGPHPALGGPGTPAVFDWLRGVWWRGEHGRSKLPFCLMAFTVLQISKCFNGSCGVFYNTSPNPER